MTQVLDWKTALRREDLVGQAVAALREGQLVAFPTETVYGIAASLANPEAVERLCLGKGRPAEKHLALAVAGHEEAMHWVPEMNLLGRRLAWRCWPGPVTLVFGGVDPGHAGGLSPRLRELVCPAGRIGLRVPAHLAILMALRQLGEPLVLTSANRSGQPAAVTASEVVEALGDEIAIVIDDGTCHFGQASTVVEIESTGWRILREGVITAADLQRASCRQIVFVCTGNTCRSPLAEGICKKLLADRLGCTPADLPARGFLVRSAGLAAMMGDRAAEEATRIANEQGIDLSTHESQPLSRQTAEQADDLVGMTEFHVAAMQSFRGMANAYLLSPEGEDLPDPIGGDSALYRRCADQIEKSLRQRVEQWVA